MKFSVPTSLPISFQAMPAAVWLLVACSAAQMETGSENDSGSSQSSVTDGVSCKTDDDCGLDEVCVDEVCVDAHSVDRDGDGVTADIDCDDNDGTKWPLENDREYLLVEDMTICPGYYSNVRLQFIDIDDIHIDASEVYFSCADWAMYHGDNAGVISVIQKSSGITVTGLSITDLPEGLPAIVIDNSSATHLTGITIEDRLSVEDRAAEDVLIQDGSDNVIDKCTFSSVRKGGTSVWIKGNSRRNIVQNSAIEEKSLSLSTSSPLVASSDETAETTIKNNEIWGGNSSISISGTDHTVEANIIHPHGTGISVGSYTSLVQDNDVRSDRNDDGWSLVGIFIWHAYYNTITQNRLEAMPNCIVYSDPNEGNDVSGNVCI